MVGTLKYPEGFDHVDYVNPNAPKGGSLRQGIIGTFDSLNPFIVRGKKAAGLEYVNDSLLGRVWDEPFSLYGLIAERISLPDDRHAIDFYLNPKATFQDGTPITAEDVIFSLTTLRDNGKPNHRTYYKQVKTITALSPTHIHLEFAQEADGTYNQELPLLIGLMPILSKNYWETQDITQTRLSPFVGSGPYKIDTISAGRHITYQRNPTYWAADLPVNKGLYNFDQLIFDYYRDDTVALEAFKAGDLDLRREGNETKWRTQYKLEAVTTGAILKEEIAHQRPEPAKGFIFNTRRPFFQNLKTRQALLYAFDFDWLNKSLWQGQFHHIRSTFPNSFLAAPTQASIAEKLLFQNLSTSVPETLYTEPLSFPTTAGTGLRALRKNLRQAGMLLDQAGWQLQNGKRYDQAGTPFQFEILLVDPADEKIALTYRQNLERLGIEVRIRTVDSAQFQQRLNNFDYDMVLYRWINSLSPGSEQLTYWGSAAAHQEGSRNYAGVQDPIVDHLITRLLQSKSAETLKITAHALDRTLMKGTYFIPLAYKGFDQLAYWQKLQHPKTIPLYGTVVESWWQKNTP